jgi:hypothetical protein
MMKGTGGEAAKAKTFSGDPGYRSRLRRLERKGLESATEGAHLTETLWWSLVLETEFHGVVDLAPVPAEEIWKELT